MFLDLDLAFERKRQELVSIKPVNYKINWLFIAETEKNIKTSKKKNKRKRSLRKINEHRSELIGLHPIPVRRKIGRRDWPKAPGCPTSQIYSQMKSPEFQTPAFLKRANNGSVINLYTFSALVRQLECDIEVCMIVFT